MDITSKLHCETRNLVSVCILLLSFLSLLFHFLFLLISFPFFPSPPSLPSSSFLLFPFPPVLLPVLLPSLPRSSLLRFYSSLALFLYSSLNVILKFLTCRGTLQSTLQLPGMLSLPHSSHFAQNGMLSILMGLLVYFLASIISFIFSTIFFNSSQTCNNF